MYKPAFHLVLITVFLSATDSVRRPANLSDEYLESCGPDRTLLHRKRRFLTFPPRSELLFRISLLKSTPWKTVVFTIHEIDVQVPIPENLHAILFENKDSMNHKSRSEGNDAFFDYTAIVLEMLGINGWACVSKLQCELMRLKQHFVDKSFLLRVLHILMSPSRSVSGAAFRRNEHCSDLFDCPLSFIPDFMKEDAS